MFVSVLRVYLAKKKQTLVHSWILTSRQPQRVTSEHCRWRRKRSHKGRKKYNHKKIVRRKRSEGIISLLSLFLFSGSIGGYLGLFLGASVLSLGEIVGLLVALVITSVRRLTLALSQQRATTALWNSGIEKLHELTSERQAKETAGTDQWTTKSRHCMNWPQESTSCKDWPTNTAVNKPAA